ncbi:MAG: S9 family peptidase [Oceanicaulis sp.]
MKTQLMRGLAAAALSAVAAGPALAQAPMEIEDIFEIRSAFGAQLSPDGRHVAFTVFDPRNVAAGEDDGSGDVELYVASGPNQVRGYVTGEGRVGAVDWTPDGEALTFLARRSGDDATSLYRIPLSGGEAQRALTFDTSIQSYAIAPDGDTVYFITGPAEDPTASKFRSMGFRANVYEEQQRFNRVFRASLSDAEAEPEEIAVDGHPSSLVLSENGRRMAVVVAPTTLVDDSLMERDWVVYDTRDGDQLARFDTPGKIGGGAFSPNGRRFAFLAGADRADPTAGTLHVGQVRSGDFEAIAREAEQHVSDIAWADNDTVLALAAIGVETAIIAYDADNGREEGRTDYSDFVVGAMDLHRRSGRIAAVADAPTHPNEIFVGADPAGLERWTDHNPQLSGIAFGDQRAFEYTARDGERIEGVLVTPQGDAPDGGWPLIMTVHGGPEAHDDDGWVNGYSRLGHIAAGDGFAVFYPNYRGSTGRGERFAKLDHLDAPGDEFWDIVDGIGALSEAGIVDSDRVGITGASYGGFASAWGATVASEHFAASAPSVALTDLISFYGTTEIPIEMVDVHFMDAPWEAWTTYLEKSPSYNAPGSTTPTLIFHGEEDTRVDPSQSYILYRMLKMESEAPVRLVTYPGEGHGNRNAAAQFDYAHRLHRWMTHYLKGDGGEPPAPALPLEDLIGGDED